jgi:uncharacterized protein YjbI with pentapeptide repeats
LDLQLAALAALEPSQRYTPVRVDIAAAIDVLSRRDRAADRRLVKFNGVNFCRVKFSNGMKFRDTDFGHADMRYCSMPLADLRHCDFESTELQGADLRYVDLRGADFYEANLYKANLGGAKLKDALLSFVDLTYVAGLTIDQLKGAGSVPYHQLPKGMHPAELAEAVESLEPATYEGIGPDELAEMEESLERETQVIPSWRRPDS